MFIVQVSQETDLFESIQWFYSKDCLVKAIHWSHWGRLCFAHSLFSSPMGTKLFRLVGLCIGDVEMDGTLVVTLWGETTLFDVVVFWGRAFKIFEVILGRWSWNGRTLCHYNMQYSVHSLLIHVMVLKCISLCATWQSTSTTGETPMTKLENGLERKKVVYLLWEFVAC